MGKEIDRSNFWLVRNNPIIKTGVFPYLGRQIGPECEPEKIYNVLRPEEELFSDTAISSFNLIPITVGHALLGSRAEGFVPPEEKGVDGTTGENSKRQGDKVINDIKLYSERIKDEIQNGKKELSAGYFCDFVPERGVWNGRHYDFVQRNIAGNHIALVEKGRNGADVRVMDSAEGLPRRNRQFVCDAMDIEGKIEQHGGDMKKNANDANWEEGKHKRDSDGKFSSTGGGAKGSGNVTEAIKKNVNNYYDITKKIEEEHMKNSPTKEDPFSIPYSVQVNLMRNNIPIKHGKSTHGREFSYVEKAPEGWKKIKGTTTQPAGYSWYENHSFKDNPKEHKQILVKDTDLSSETNGDGGKHAAPNKENEMDKREVIREIMAISAKPVTEFEGGEEEKVEAIAKLAEKLAYNPSEAGANDACPGSNPKDEPKDNASDEDDPKDEPKDEPKEDKKAASLDEMEKELLARMGRKTELVKRLTPIIGAFDSAAMTEKEVAAYACEKLGKKVAMDEAVNYLNGYLDAYKPASARVTLGAAPKSAAQDEALVNFLKGE